jgi:hypothetical protein
LETRIHDCRSRNDSWKPRSYRKQDSARPMIAAGANRHMDDKPNTLSRGSVGGFSETAEGTTRRSLGGGGLLRLRHSGTQASPARLVNRIVCMVNHVRVADLSGRYDESSIGMLVLMPSRRCNRLRERIDRPSGRAGRCYLGWRKSPLLVAMLLTRVSIGFGHNFNFQGNSWPWPSRATLATLDSTCSASARVAVSLSGLGLLESGNLVGRSSPFTWDDVAGGGRG